MSAHSNARSESAPVCPLDNRCHVFHFGLSRREVLVLESLFRLHADLQRRYAFAPPTDIEPSNVLFIDGDNPDAVAQWHSYHHRHPETVAVLVCSNPPADSDTVTLTKPLSFRHLEDIRYVLRLVTPVDMIEAAEDEPGLHVLVVDDSATARELMQACLADAANNNSMPVHIDFAISGEDALEKASHKHYDLVFLDVVMPGLDGYEVCRQLKERHISRIALLTGRGEAADYALGRAAGCDHYLAKPAPAAMVNTVVRLTAMKKAMPTH